MGEQLSLLSTDIDPAASLEPFEVPKAARRKRAKDIWPRDKPLAANDTVVLIHRLGTEKEVRFCRILNSKIAHIRWPVANEVLEVSLNDGHVKASKKKKALKDWKVEPGALRAMRKLASEMPAAKGHLTCPLEEDSHS